MSYEKWNDQYMETVTFKCGHVGPVYHARPVESVTPPRKDPRVCLACDKDKQ